MSEKTHICQKSQSQYYNSSLKNDLKLGEILINIHYSENYTNNNNRKYKPFILATKCFPYLGLVGTFARLMMIWLTEMWQFSECESENCN